MNQPLFGLNVHDSSSVAHRIFKEENMNIVLIGAQGSGKGTQAGLLTQALGLHHLSSGDLFRWQTTAPAERANDRRPGFAWHAIHRCESIRARYQKLGREAFWVARLASLIAGDAASRPQDADHRGQQGEHDHRGNHVMDSLANVGNAASERVAA